jgi:hypothetical protein
MDDGAVIATAEGFVGDDEPVWNGGQVTDRYGKIKTYEKRPEYAKRAMAQTRAISRACRSAFAHVVVMMDAGLSTTPAEEVPEGGFDSAKNVTEPAAHGTAYKTPPATKPTSTPTAPAAPAEKPHNPPAEPRHETQPTQGVVGVFDKVFNKTGSSSRGEWNKWSVKVNGTYYSTFDRPIGESLDAMTGQTVEIRYTTDAKGYHTIAEVLATDAPPTPVEETDNIPF